MVNFTDYFPSQTLAESGKAFLDNVIGALFDQTKDSITANVQLATEYKSGDRALQLKNVPVDLKVGDPIIITNDIGDNVVVPYDVYDSSVGSYRTIRIPTFEHAVYEVRTVKSIAGKVIGLDYPFDNNYNIDTTIYVKINQEPTHTVLLEDISLSSDSALKTNSLTDDNFLNTYRIYTDPTNGDIYDIPLTNTKIFKSYPDINSINVAYIEPSTLHRVSLQRDIDYFVDSTEYTINGVSIAQNADKSIKFVIKRDGNTTKPATVTGQPRFRLLQIEYKPLIPSSISVSDQTIQANYGHGVYLRQSDITYDINGDFLTGFPLSSINMMACGDEIKDWAKLGTEYAIKDYKYLTGIDERYNILPLKEEELIYESRNIYSIKGTQGSISNLVSMTGVTVPTIEEEYALMLADGLNRYETFALNQPQIPSYGFLKTLHQFLDTSSQLLKNVTTGYGNSGAYAHTTYAGNFELSFTIGAVASCQLGVTTEFVDYGNSSMECAIQLDGSNNIDLVVSGVVQSASVDTYIIGDVVSIKRESGTYNAYKNGSLIGTFTLTTTPSLPIVTFDTANAAIFNATITNGGITTDVFWVGDVGVRRGVSILQRRLEEIIPYTVYASAGSITLPNDGYGLDGYGDSEYGSPQAPATQTAWTDYELRLVYAYMVSRVDIFLPVFHDTIKEALRVLATIDIADYNYPDLMVLSLFSMTVDRGINSMYSGTDLDIRAEVNQIIDLTKPFSRYLSDDSFVENTSLVELETAYTGKTDSLVRTITYSGMYAYDYTDLRYPVGLSVTNYSGSGAGIGLSILNSSNSLVDMVDTTSYTI